MTIEVRTEEIYAGQDAEIAKAQKITREKVESYIEASKRHGLTLREGPSLAGLISDKRIHNYQLTDDMLKRAIAETSEFNVIGDYQKAIPSILERTVRGCVETPFAEFVSHVIKNFEEGKYIQINGLVFCKDKSLCVPLK